MDIADEYYSGNFDQMDPKERRKLRVKQQVIAGLVTILFLGGIVLAIKVIYPDTYYKTVASFNPQTNNAEAKQERQRISRISLLPISKEKKEILIRNTIFMGASPQMVTLGLGEPREKAMGINEKTQAVELHWTYHFAHESRPTVLQFSDNKLVSAHKKSAQ